LIAPVSADSCPATKPGYSPG